MPETTVTIAICTYDRYPILQKSIAAVAEHCDLNGKSAQLLIVENTPEGKRKLIELPEVKGARIVVCDELGLAHARNAAISNTDTDVIIFLDDDAFVRAGWLDGYFEAFDSVEDAWIVGGRCHALYEMDPLPNWFDKKLNGYLSCIDWGDAAKFITPSEWVVGANVGFRRTVFDTYGNFDVTLGRKGSATLLSNEETALMDKVGRDHIYYQPKAEVDHFVPADRVTLQWFRKRVYWQAVSDMLAGGTPWYKPDEAAKEYDRIIIETEAEYRNLALFTYRPRNFTDFENQLRAIYLAAMSGAEGYRFASV